jgi:hypothetical protein
MSRTNLGKARDETVRHERKGGVARDETVQYELRKGKG